MRHMNERNQPRDAQYLYLVPRAITANAGVSVSYALSPRTEVGLNMSSSRAFSSIQDAYTTSASGFIGRTIGRRWFAQVHGGGGFITNLHSHYPSGAGTSPVFGGSLGYRTSAHGFLGSYDHTLGQSYGVGAAGMTSIAAAWNWWRPGHHWGLNRSYMRQEFSKGAFGNVQGWRAAFGLTRQLGDHLVLETAYTYGAYSSASTPLLAYDSAQHAIRLSLMFTPQPRERH